jgi:hypothetical protein
MDEDFVPTRLCCMQKHWGPICPDGKVMCDLCFGRFDQDELMVDDEGVKWNICQKCHEEEKKVMERLHGETS